jgi:AcrR family transcriptional regulator
MGIIGQETLSMRAVARKLGLAPNALYYYFPDRKTLEAAVAAEGTRRIHAVLKKAAARSQGASGVRAVCRAYLRFARSNPALYAMMMRAYPGVPELAAARADLRRFTLELFAGHTDPATAGKASFAAWSLLHGLVVLERGGLLEAKLSADAWFAISALLSGLSSR